MKGFTTLHPEVPEQLRGTVSRRLRLMASSSAGAPMRLIAVGDRGDGSAVLRLLAADAIGARAMSIWTMAPVAQDT